MKILLVEPPKAPVTMAGEDIHIFESLALEYVAAGVAEDHAVKILDMRLDKDLQGTLDRFQPDVVGITAYTVHVNTVKRLFKKIKEWNPEVLTVVGGHHATVMPEDFLSSDIDLVVVGEGVSPFAEIVARFERSVGFENIPGVVFAKKDRLVRNDCPLQFDLDALPFPARRLTAPYRRHYQSEWMKPLASIRTSKGCPFRCNFCALWKITSGRYMKRKPECIVEELGTIEEACVFFADDESLVDVKRMKTLAGMLKASGMRKRYFLYGRSDTIAGNPELLEMWKGIGLERVFVGLEFFRDEDLAYIRKGYTPGDNEKAVKILQDLDINIYASFILRPEFNRADFAAFREYSLQLGLNFASFAVLTPLPGTDFYDNVKNKLITRNYDYFDFIHTVLPTALPLKEFYHEYLQLYRKATSLKNQFGLLFKFAWRDMVPIIRKSIKWQKRLKRAYLDYEDAQKG